MQFLMHKNATQKLTQMRFSLCMLRCMCCILYPVYIIFCTIILCGILFCMINRQEEWHFVDLGTGLIGNAAEPMGIC